MADEKWRPSMEMGFQLHPLVEFIGEFKGYRTERAEGRQPRIFLEFINIKPGDIIQSREPYPFPIATIDMPVALNRYERVISDTVWAVFSKSVTKALGETPGEHPLDVMTGKRVHMKYDHAMLSRRVMDEEGNPTSQYAVQPGECWQVVSVEGMGQKNANGKSFTETLVEILDGKDQDGFTAAFTSLSPEVKRNPGYKDAMRSHLDETLLPSLVDAGLVTRDTDGIYHRV